MYRPLNYVLLSLCVTELTVSGGLRGRAGACAPPFFYFLLYKDLTFFDVKLMPKSFNLKFQISAPFNDCNVLTVHPMHIPIGICGLLSSSLILFIRHDLAQVPLLYIGLREEASPGNPHDLVGSQYVGPSLSASKQG